jgi:hypothetical protein
MSSDPKKRQGGYNKHGNKPRYEKIIIGVSDTHRREKLLLNAECGLGTAVQRGRHLSYTVGNDDFGYVEYFILYASIPSLVKDEAK